MMDCKANLVGVSNDFLTGKVNLTFSTDDKWILQNVEQVKAKDLHLNVKKWSDKRSLSSNSYFHVLIGKMAEVLGISIPYCKNMMIARYGQQFFLENGEMFVIKTNYPVEKMMEHETLHTYPCGSEIQNGKEIVFYRVYRPTHTYDNREMSILINGVVEECKNMGIQTLSDNEIRQMNERWGIKENQQ